LVERKGVKEKGVTPAYKGLDAKHHQGEGSDFGGERKKSRPFLGDNASWKEEDKSERGDPPNSGGILPEKLIFITLFANRGLVKRGGEKGKHFWELRSTKGL